ncbi:VRR-NUC domain-containing protein [Grimontia sp. S25]|uniref:phosphodiesterase I n=1 Tax=Grimontia sedimenti TaxID=2711294 RepID=A0A6M1RA36_9GAMM|nr:VRR-NUC domain-containing protein [Grimontia sedimenti]NGN96966.1 VRR-NUC domain-containing protein [Grimontia sedimenti]
MSPLTTPPVLPPHYYLDNFLSIVDVVSTRYSDLLTETETHWLTAFSALPKNAQLLLVRLLTRKGDWFRCDKLIYPEIPDIEIATKRLSEEGFLTETTQPPFEIVAKLMTKAELLSLYCHLSIKATLRKPEIIATIAENNEEAVPPLPTRFLCLKHDVLPVFLLLYFGNSRQDLSQFVLNDLGIYRFESVRLRPEDRLFTSREQIADWLFLSSLADLYWEYTEAKEVTSALKVSQQLPEKPDWPPLTRKWERLANKLAREFERQKDEESAQHLFSQSSLPPARERLARIAIKQTRFEDAAAIVTDMLTAPKNEDEADVAARIARQLAKKTDCPSPEKAGEAFGSEHITLVLNERVELESARHYAKQGWQVWYCENSLLNALFGLLLWDIIFAPVPGAFLNPFQRAPRDMYSTDFTTARREMIEQRFEALEQGEYDLLAVYDAKFGITNDWVNWSWAERNMIEAALSTMSPTQIIACIKRILFDAKSNRAGHPDLFMVKEGKCQLVEVKGPGDKLQHHQVRWLNFFTTQGLSAHTLYVSADIPKQADDL